MKIAEKLSVFAAVLIMEEVGQVPVPEKSFSGGKELSTIVELANP